MFIIPLEKLSRACRSQLDKVTHEWPDGIPLNEQTAERAVELKLDIDWAAAELLPSKVFVEYRNQLCKSASERDRKVQKEILEYQDTKALAMTEYQKIKKEMLIQVCEAHLDINDTSEAWKNYVKIANEAWEKYERVVAPVIAEHELRKAKILLDLLLKY